jgi:uncharacterized membrane protein YdjX (TVP38/TMEM64 family)
MKRHWVRIVVITLVVTAAALAKYLLLGEFLSAHHLKEHKELLLSFIRTHYLQAIFSFISLYIGTGLFLPGALVLTVAGGMMFGTVPAMIYANIGATTGAVLAFVAARFVLGGWIQERFKEQLQRFNDELSLHGPHYLLTLRILPIAPFFVVNYCAGITKIPLKTFVWTTSVGMLPGSFIYCLVGEQLRAVNTFGDLLSWKIMLALVVLALFAMLPVILHHMQAARK